MSKYLITQIANELQNRRQGLCDFMKLLNTS